MSSPQSILKHYWGYDAFRPGQEDIIATVLEKQDVLALLPTGGGKSLCYQVPALALEGLTIVISPLIALMKDQVDQLRNRDIPAAALHSGLSRSEQRDLFDLAVNGYFKLLYLSPERLQSESFLERVPFLNIALIAVDEAHCISQWGHEFRPAYRKINEFRALIPEVPVLALTATATPKVVEDIAKQLALKKHKVFKQSFKRSNLSFLILQEASPEERLLSMLQRVPGAALVYVRNRRRCHELAVFLHKKGIKAHFYHAGLTAKERSERQEAWIKNQFRVMVATNAFGMGIDKSDVRMVVHLDLPESPEAYYQEAGRAGRDGLSAYAVMLWSSDMISTNRKRLEMAHPEIAFIKKVYQALANQFQLAVGAGTLSTFPFYLEIFCKTYNLPMAETWQTLKVLEAEGFIQLNEAMYKPSTLKVLVSQEALYDFQLRHTQWDEFIRKLLRYFGGGIFGNLKMMQEHVVSKAFGISTDEFKRKVLQLEKEGMLEYNPMSDSPSLTYLLPRQDAAYLPLDLPRLEARRADDERRAKAMETLVQDQRHCRMMLILEYFEEAETRRCGLCDVCRKQKKEDPKLIIEQASIILEEQAIKKRPLLDRLNLTESTVLNDWLDAEAEAGRLVCAADGTLIWKK